MNTAPQAARTPQRLPLYEERSCGECDACCTGMSVTLALDEDPPQAGWHDAPQGRAKAEGVPCMHLRPKPEAGCAVYEDRPRACSGWSCLWRMGALKDEHRPDKIGALLHPEHRPGWENRVLYAVATDPQGFARAAELLKRLAQDRIVILTDGPRRIFYMGPPDEVAAYQAAFPPTE